MSDGPAEHAGRSVAASAGAALGGLFGAVARLRRSKPLHPQGVLLGGRLVRDGRARSGITWIDTPADDALVRLSRSVGLPPRLPDVQGLALRVGAVDVLPDATRRLPADPTAWPVELSAEPLRLTMLWAGVLGAWSPFGHLIVGGRAGDRPEPLIRFEPAACPGARGLRRGGAPARTRLPGGSARVRHAGP